MEEMKFCVGDRVECLVNHPDKNENIVIGSTGIVCDVDGYHIGVRWDDDVSGYACDGLCEDGHGWYMDPHKIRLCDDASCEDPFEFDENALSDLLFGA